MGRSAGAQIAMASAANEAVEGVLGVISLYGPADLLFAYENGASDDILGSLRLLEVYLGGYPAMAPEAYRTASPYLTASGRMPPKTWSGEIPRDWPIFCATVGWSPVTI
jgi:hypothetical protein